MSDDIRRTEGLVLDSDGTPVWIGTVTGAPSSDQSGGRATVQMAIRNDASTGSTVLYVSINAGSNWAFLSGSNEMQKSASSASNGAAIPVTSQGTVYVTTAGAETRTLAAPSWASQTLSLYMKTDGGDCVITASAAVNATGNNTITLNDAGDSITLVGVHNGTALVWRVLANDGAGLSTV